MSVQRNDDPQPAPLSDGYPLQPDTQQSPYERLKQAILRGDLAPGTPLIETSIAEWCGVSRSPVREALSRLEQDGLVARSTRGVVVRTVTEEEILDIYATRIIMEATAASWAAERRMDRDVARIRRALERYRSTEGQPARLMAEANREFHRCTWQAAHSESLLDLLERLTLHLGRHPETTLEYPGRFARSVTEHGGILGAIEARDSQAAGELASQHFAAARNIRLRLWEGE